MRIWIVNQYAISPSETGGLRPYLLARQLQERGHEPTIIASSYNHWTRSETRLKPGEKYRFETEGGVPFVWLRTLAYPGNDWRRAVSMLTFARRVLSRSWARGLDRPDMIIGSNPHLFGATASALLARRFDAPFIFEIRDLWPQSLVEVGRMSRFHPGILVLRAIERWLYRAAARIITVLPNAVRYFRDHGVREENVLWLPNGVTLDQIPESALPEDREPFTFMFAGIHGRANGLDTVLEAAEILQNQGLGERIQIRLVGDGAEKARLQQMASERGLSNVRFEDPVPKSAIYDRLMTADAFIMILNRSPVFRWGVSPNKLWDYMAVGRPVVYSVESSNNPIQEAGAGVTVEVEDPPSLAEGMKELAGLDRGQREAMGQKAREYIRAHNDFSVLGDKLEAFLKDALPVGTAR